MRPSLLLASVVGLSLLARVVASIAQRLRRRQFRRLARQWGMGYTQRDPFNLAWRLAGQLPFPAAADLRVLDLLHGVEGDQHRYVFTVEYTTGVVSAHRRQRRVMTFSEPRDPAGHSRGEPLVAAPEHLSRLDQYQHLKDNGWQAACDKKGSPAGERGCP